MSFYNYHFHIKGKALDSVSFLETLQSLTLSGHSRITFIINMKYDSYDILGLSSLYLPVELSAV